MIPSLKCNYSYATNSNNSMFFPYAVDQKRHNRRSYFFKTTHSKKLKSLFLQLISTKTETEKVN